MRQPTLDSFLMPGVAPGDDQDDGDSFEHGHEGLGGERFYLEIGLNKDCQTNSVIL